MRNEKYTLQTSLGCIPQGVTPTQIWPHGSLPLPPSLSLSFPPFLFPSLFFVISPPRVLSQSVPVGHLSECATSSLDTLQGRHDPDGQRGEQHPETQQTIDREGGEEATQTGEKKISFGV